MRRKLCGCVLLGSSAAALARPSLSAMLAERQPWRAGPERTQRVHASSAARQPHSYHRQSNRSRGGPMKDRYPPVTVDLADPRRRLAVLVDGTNTQLLQGCTTREDLLSRSALFTTVLPAVATRGAPILLRVFAHQLPAEWGPLLQPSSPASGARSSAPAAPDATHGASGSGSSGGSTAAVVPLRADSAAGAGGGVLIEYFRVERFIPIPMQIEADAQHLFDFRAQNKVEGVCYVCHEVDRALYEALMDQQAGAAASGETDVSSLLQQARRTLGTGEKAFFNQYLLDELGIVKESVVDGRSADGS